MTNNEKMVVENKNDQRPFTMIYHDFLSSQLLDYYEKLIFIFLKKHADGKTFEAYPSLDTLSRETGISKRKVQTCLKHMKELGVIEIKKRKIKNGNRSNNLYIVHDYKSMWTANEQKKDPEKSSTTTTSQSPQQNISAKNDTKKIFKSQVTERYSEEWIIDFFEFEALKDDNPTEEAEIDTVISILYTILNTNKATIKVNREDKPAMTVIARMLKLNQETIMYAINQFTEQTNKIKHPRAYMLTCLYNAQEQYSLALRNQVVHDMACWGNENE